jgi:hypothetical protein
MEGGENMGKEYDVWISVRMTPAEKKEIHRQAKECGMSISEYVRNAIRGVSPVSRVDREAVTNLKKTGGLLKLAITRGYDEEKLNKILLVLIKITKELQEEGDIKDDRKKNS